MFDQNIVLDICSGSIHVVDEIAYDMIAEFLDKDKNTLVLEMKEKYPSVETSELGRMLRPDFRIKRTRSFI